MIPLQLQLTNFLSYRSTAVLDFEGVHLACISGLNGAGKSSILDGITWALFGRSRSKSDDDLVNRLAALNGDSADVRLTFSLEASSYRIIRQKKPGARTILELHMETGPDEWKTLTESGVRDTQGAIEELLRMNYDTFINASFLLQGKADEFTTKTPNRRKEVLAELLGVSKWDRYKEAAAAKRKEMERQLALLDSLLSEIELELDEEPERKAAVADAVEELATIEARVADKEALLQQLRRAEAAVEQQRQLINNLSDNLARAQRRLADLQQTRQRRLEEMEAYQAILVESDDILADFAAWQKLDDAVQDWQSQAEEFHRLQRARQPHELAVTQIRSRLEQQQQELERQRSRAEQALEERLAVEQAYAAANELLGQIRDSLAHLAQREQEWHAAQSDLQRLEGERRLLAQESDQLKKEAIRVEMATADKTAVTASAQEAEQLLADLDERIDANSEQNRQLQTNRADLDSLEKEQPRLRQQMKELRASLDQLDVETGGECPLCGQPLSEEHRHSVMSQLQAQGEELRDRFRTNETRIETLKQEVIRLSESIKQLPRLERDQRAQQQRKATAEARLEEITRIVTAWETGGNASRLDELETALADDSAVIKQRQRVAKLESVTRERVELAEDQQTHLRQASEAEARLAEIDRIVTEWKDAGETALEDVKRRLENMDYAPEAQAALQQLEKQIKTLAYDEAAHLEARQKRDELAHAPDRHQRLKEAEAALKSLEKTLADLSDQMSDQDQMVADFGRQHESALAELEVLSAEGGDLRQVEDEVFRLREMKAAADRRVGSAETKLNVLDDLRARRQQLTSDRADVTQQIRRLKLLEQACGRNGVQALLIEQALPDIEDRANELLERLTAGDMRVSFETQKQLKSRDAIAETLDIRIIDSAGERPYTNFSGGEQFRVNFAIRLALSQLLAKRAGARLQTLVIDEGFGSQDPSGRQRLVEAINAVQDDFACILVITHIDELRDAFSTRIEVEKTLAGSTITVS